MYKMALFWQETIYCFSILACKNDMKVRISWNYPVADHVAEGREEGIAFACRPPDPGTVPPEEGTNSCPRSVQRHMSLETVVAACCTWTFWNLNLAMKILRRVGELLVTTTLKIIDYWFSLFPGKLYFINAFVYILESICPQFKMMNLVWISCYSKLSCLSYISGLFIWTNANISNEIYPWNINQFIIFQVSSWGIFCVKLLSASLFPIAISM